MKTSLSHTLKSGVATIVVGTALLVGQAALAQQAAPPPQPADTPEETNTIIVTGSMIHNLSQTNAASPVSVVTADDIQKRGITTVQGAIQSLASNGGPTLTNSYSANGAFAGGASGASLRALSTNSTLVLFDGLRAAYYPLADDGSRNFVDLNTIPDAVVDRVEVLRDGASSIYGADAIAGVINIITKKQFKGIQGEAQAGVTQRGYGANQRLSLTAGFGDLSSQGWNFYLSGHYVHSSQIKANELPYPYNTDNQTGICYQGTCGPDNSGNSSINFTGISTLTPFFYARPANAATNAAIPGSRYQLLNPAAGCQGLPSYNLTAAQSAQFTNAPSTVCTVDSVAQGGVIEPESTRWGVTAHAAANLGSKAEGWLEFNYEQSKVAYTGYGLSGSGLPVSSLIRANAPAGIFFPRFSTSSASNGSNDPNSFVLSLPVYICPRGTTVACTAANGTLNPNNPFAGAGQRALIIGTLPDVHQYSASTSRAYRLAGGVNGHFGANDDWNYRVEGVGMITTLDRRFEGYVYIQHLLDVINDGSYNFVNAAANSQAVRDYLAPSFNASASSRQYQVQASVDHAFFKLPGGDLTVAVGGSVRYEGVNDPSANSDANGPTQRYFVINAFGTIGHRYVESGFFEINAPVLDQVTIDGSGRYDHYSTGQSHFSPKIGVVINPIEQISLHGTISGGFRIPSFGETASIPTTGYVPYFTQLPNNYLANFGTGCATSAAAKCSAYVSGYSVGETGIANPNLQPEKSRNITVGVEFKPTRAIRLTAEYYNIRKTGAIIPQSFTSVLQSYYASPSTFVLPTGYTILFNGPDVNNPAAPPTIAAIGAPYINATTISTDGWDFGANVRLPIGSNGLTFSSQLEAEYIHKLNTTFPDGHTEHYAGTIGNYNLTAGTGTPHWKGTWQNTLEFGKAGSITATAYYTSGYNLSAEDQGNVAGDCGLNSGFQACDVRRFIDVDLNATLNVGDRFSFYVNVLNVFNARAPLDTATYGGYLYNPSIAEAGILGRAFSAGVKVKM